MPPKTKTAFQLDSPYADVLWPQINTQDQEAIVELLVNLLSPVGVHRKTHCPPSKGNRSKKRKHAETSSIPPPPEISSQLHVGLNSITRHLTTSSTYSCPSTLSLPSPELTLILAATSNTMGVGKSGTLPWTGLKKEMSYFARVTKRSPPSSSPDPPKNVVIMGRKTWESIPEKFRPLKGRINIVLSRSYPSKAQKGATQYGDEPVKVASLEAALGALQCSVLPVGKVFVIGGVQIWKAALGLASTKRVLLTRTLSDFECDTHFPITLGGEKGAIEWEKKSKEELDQWVGEEVPADEVEENGVKYIYEMYERRAEPAAHMAVLFTTRQPSPPLTSHLPMLANTASLAHPDKPATRLVVLAPRAETKICEALGIARAGFIGLVEGDALGTKALVEFVREKVPVVNPGKWLEDGLTSYKETRINAVQVPVPQLQKK